MTWRVDFTVIGRLVAQRLARWSNDHERRKDEKRGRETAVFLRDITEQVRPTAGNLASLLPRTRSLIDGANISSRNYPGRLGPAFLPPNLNSSFAISPPVAALNRFPAFTFFPVPPYYLYRISRSFANIAIRIFLFPFVPLRFWRSVNIEEYRADEFSHWRNKFRHFYFGEFARAFGRIFPEYL